MWEYIRGVEVEGNVLMIHLKGVCSLRMIGQREGRRGPEILRRRVRLVPLW